MEDGKTTAQGKTGEFPNNKAGKEPSLNIRGPKPTDFQPLKLEEKNTKRSFKP